MKYHYLFVDNNQSNSRNHSSKLQQRQQSTSYHRAKNKQIEAISKQTSIKHAIQCTKFKFDDITISQRCLQIQKLKPFKKTDLTIASPGRVGHVEEVSLRSSGRGRRKRGRESSGGSGTNAARAIARETETRDEDVEDDENDGSGVQFFD